MRSTLTSVRKSSRALPGILILALVLGIFLPGAVHAAPDSGKRRPAAAYTYQRGNAYYVAPRYSSRPSCGQNNRYNPSNRCNPSYNEPYYTHPRHSYDRDSRCDATHYRVRRGDTLSGIARRYGTSVQALAWANHLRNPHRIYAGQVLYIPAHGYCR